MINVITGIEVVSSVAGVVTLNVSIQAIEFISGSGAVKVGGEVVRTKTIDLSSVLAQSITFE